MTTRASDATDLGGCVPDSALLQSARESLNILLADDDPVARKFVSVMIEHLGYGRPDLADNGPDAVHAALNRRYDLLLIDLPDLDVTQSVRELKHKLDRQAPCIVAMLDPEESVDERQRFIDAGVDTVVDKPLPRRQLLEVLASATRRNTEAQAQDFNPANWNEMRAVLGQKGVIRIAEALARDIPEQMQRCDAARAADDLQALKQIAHALRGASLQLGAEALAELCSATETACTANDAMAALSLSAHALARYCSLVEHLVEQVKSGCP